MHRSCLAKLGTVLIAAVAFFGCGGDTTPTPGSGFLEGGEAVPFKSTDTSQFDGMMKQMQESMKNKAYTKKPAPTKQDANTKKP